MFVSYAHQDEQYVEEVLVPGLEETKELKYKCFVHVRDFVPGRAISEQIVEAVDNSKRTLICLSKHFLASDWAKQEFEVAHRKNRVVIILVGELPSRNEMSEDIWNYIHNNTYLASDDKWFWEKLQYALPHGVDRSNGGTHFSLATVSDRLKFTKSSMARLEVNDINGIDLASDDFAMADEHSNTNNIHTGHPTGNGSVQPNHNTHRASSPVTSSITTIHSPNRKNGLENDMN